MLGEGVAEWVSINTSLSRHLSESEYQRIARKYAESKWSNSVDLSRYSFEGAVPMVPSGFFFSSRLRDTVWLQIDQKRKYWVVHTNGTYSSDYLEVFMTKTGRVVQARKSIWGGRRIVE